MAKVLMMRGLPASGKSTKAKELMEKYGNYFRLNRDLLRKMLHFDKWSGKKELVTIAAQNQIGLCLLKEGYNIIIDDTNLGQRHEDRWKNLALSVGAKFEIVPMETDVMECISRDTKRTESVGRHVIMGMAMQYNLYEPETGYVICDLDGTLCNIDHRLEYVKQEPKKWDTFFALMRLDKRNDEVYDMIKGAQENTFDIVFVSGRPERYRKHTEDWLKLNVPDIKYTNLIMRGDHDKRPDVDVKRDILNKYFPDRSLIEFVIDDRPSVVQMWKDELLPVHDVGKGVEF